MLDVSFFTIFAPCRYYRCAIFIILEYWARVPFYNAYRFAAQAGMAGDADSIYLAGATDVGDLKALYFHD